MIALLHTALIAFALHGHGLMAPPQSRTSVSVRMGFFDDLKKGFENEPKLTGKRADVNAAGVNKNVPDYVKKKTAERAAEDARAEAALKKKAASKSEPKGDRTLEDLFSGWTWK